MENKSQIKNIVDKINNFNDYFQYIISEEFDDTLSYIYNLYVFYQDENNKEYVNIYSYEDKNESSNYELIEKYSMIQFLNSYYNNYQYKYYSQLTESENKKFSEIYKLE